MSFYEFTQLLEKQQYELVLTDREFVNISVISIQVRIFKFAK